MPMIHGAMHVIQSAMHVVLLGSFSSNHLPKRQFIRGSFVRQPEEKADSIYLIEAGKVGASFLSPQGHDVPLLELGAGDFVGDVSASGRDEPGTYFQAIEDTQVSILTRGQFLETLRNLPEFAELVTTSLYKRLRTMRQLYIENRLLPMKTRLYAELMRRGVRDAQGQLCIAPTPTHAELARQIASQRETVTKQMSQLTKMGVINSSRGFIAIADEAYLRAEIRKDLDFMDDQ